MSDFELKKIPFSLNYLKENIAQLIEDHVETIDYEGTCFYKKYYLEGFKDGIRLNEELR